jgi:hypothetical protein
MGSAPAWLAHRAKATDTDEVLAPHTTTAEPRRDSLTHAILRYASGLERTNVVMAARTPVRGLK